MKSPLTLQKYFPCSSSKDVSSSYSLGRGNLFTVHRVMSILERDESTTPVQMSNNTHLRKLNAVHPDRPSVRAPIALGLTRRATLLRSQALVLAHDGKLNSSSA